jgi:hypothetical protein
MKVLRACALATAVAGSCVSLPASAFLNNWYFCTDGSAACSGASYASGTLMSQYADLVGPSVIETTVPDGSGNFTFDEYGALNSPGHDGGSAYTTGNYITATFTGSGSGTLDGPITFDAYSGGLGVINVYSDTVDNFGSATYPLTVYGADDGTLIATFLVQSGDGSIDATGIPNGQITLTGLASYMLPNYFFDATGTDLSTLVGTPSAAVLGFATTNASYTDNPSTVVVSDIVNGFAGISPFLNQLPVGDGGTHQIGQFVVGNNGQYRLLTTTVPEPATLTLFGAGLIGLGAGARRRSRKS